MRMDMIAATKTPVTAPAMIGVVRDFELLELAVCVGEAIVVTAVDGVTELARPALLSIDTVAEVGENVGL